MVEGMSKSIGEWMSKWLGGWADEYKERMVSGWVSG